MPPLFEQQEQAQGSPSMVAASATTLGVRPDPPPSSGPAPRGHLYRLSSDTVQPSTNDGKLPATRRHQQQQRVCWRMDPTDSLSDWTISIVHSITGDTKTYHVHRVVLAVGPNACGYFKDLFVIHDQIQNQQRQRRDEPSSSSHRTTIDDEVPYRRLNSFEDSPLDEKADDLLDGMMNLLRNSTNKSHDNNSGALPPHHDHNDNDEDSKHTIRTTTHNMNRTTRIMFLHAEACDLFPLFLDYLYGKTIGLETKTAVGLYFLAKYFQQVKLQKQLLNEFMKQDLTTLKQIQKYYSDALYYFHHIHKDIPLFDLIATKCGTEYIRDIGPSCSFLYEMSPTFFAKMIHVASSTTKSMKTTSSKLSPFENHNPVAAAGIAAPPALALLQETLYHISILVAEYLSNHCHIGRQSAGNDHDENDENDDAAITHSIFQQLTSRERLPLLDVRAAVKLLVLEQHFLLRRRKEQLQLQTSLDNQTKTARSTRTNAAESSSLQASIAASLLGETNRQVQQILLQHDTKQNLQQLLLQQLPSCLQQRCIQTIAEGWVQFSSMDPESTAMAMQQLPTNVLVRLTQSIAKHAYRQREELEQDFDAALQRERYYKINFENAIQERDQAKEEVQSVNTYFQTTKNEIKGQLHGLIRRNETSKEEWLAERQYWQDQQDVWELEQQEHMEERDRWQQEKQELKHDLKEANREIKALKRRLQKATSERTDPSQHISQTLGNIVESAFSFENDSFYR